MNGNRSKYKKTGTLLLFIEFTTFQKKFGIGHLPVVSFAHGLMLAESAHAA